MDRKAIWRDDRDCIQLDQDRNNWWALVNMAMNLWVSGSVGNQSVTLQVTNAMKIITTEPIIHMAKSSVLSTVQSKLQLETTNTTPATYSHNSRDPRQLRDFQEPTCQQVKPWDLDDYEHCGQMPHISQLDIHLDRTQWHSLFAWRSKTHFILTRWS